MRTVDIPIFHGDYMEISLTLLAGPRAIPGRSPLNMKLVRRKCWLALMCVCGALGMAKAQSAASPVDSSKMVYAYIDGKDTIPWMVLPEVVVYANAPKHLQRRIEEWTRLRNAVYVTYPYARIAAGVLKDVNAHIDDFPTKAAKKEYLRAKEAELKKQFGPKIEDLSVYQGKVLIKLIYRETGTDCYDLIKQLKGGFSARVWQTVAFVFGSNLKSAYSPQENADIENIVEEIESNPYYYNAYYYQYRHYN